MIGYRHDLVSDFDGPPDKLNGRQNTVAEERVGVEVVQIVISWLGAGRQVGGEAFHCLSGVAHVELW